jgi:hypothetical protein
VLLEYLLAFGLTLVVEVPIYVVALTAAAGVGWRRSVAAGVLVNVATHPALWFTLRAHPGWFAPAEAFVCVVEWLLLGALTGRRGPIILVASICANSASALAGILLLN